MATILEIMQSRLGIQEVPGAKDNPVILGWFKAAGHPEVDADEVSWCAACASSACLEAGLPMPPVNVNLMARSFLTWGVKVELDDVQPGDIAVWPRGNSSWQGHVNVVEKVADLFVSCIGGNQSGLKGGDAVTRAKPRAKSEALGFRRPVAATVPALRAAGSREIAKGDMTQNAGGALTVLSAAWAAVQSLFGPVDVPAFADLKEGLGWWEMILRGASAVGKLVADHPWLAVTLLGGGVFILLGRQLKAARVAKHAAGMPLSVEVAKMEAANAAG